MPYCLVAADASFERRARAAADKNPLGATLVKIDIVNEVVGRTGISKSKADAAVETIFENMKKALARGERIELRGFAIFDLRPRKTGVGRNPRSGTQVPISPGKVVRFKPGKGLQALQ